MSMLICSCQISVYSFLLPMSGSLQLHCADNASGDQVKAVPSGSFRESEAETDAGSGGAALLEVVPETQPAPASPGAALSIEQTSQREQQREQSTQGNGNLSSLTQKSGLKRAAAHTQSGE